MANLMGCFELIKIVASLSFCVNLPYPCKIAPCFWMDGQHRYRPTNYSGDNTCDVYVNSNALQEHYQYDI